MTNNSWTMQGKLDDIRIYNRLLNGDEIALLADPTNDNTPAAPDSLSIESYNSEQVELQWNDNSTNEEGFIIERKTGTEDFAQVGTVNMNIESYTDVTVQPGTNYTYRILAYNASGNSAGSNEVNVTTPYANDLIAYWPFEEGNGTITEDASGNNHDGTFLNGASFTTDHQKGSYGLNLDGNNDYVNTGTINLGDQFTLSLWAMIPSGIYGIQTLIANGQSGYGNGFKLLVNTYNTTDRMIKFETSNGSSILSAYTSTNKFVLGLWNHVAVVVNRIAGTANIYYNGINSTSSSSIRSDFGINNALHLGSMTDNSWTMQGKLDDIRIYNQLLNGDEIALLADPTKSTGKEPGNELVIYPNPFNDNVTILNTENIRKIEILDLMGKVISLNNNIASPEMIIDLSYLKDGLYIIKLTDKSDFSIMKQIIKQ